MTKANPAAIVAKIHLTIFARSPRDEAATAMTIVKLLVNKQNVMTVEKMMLGEKVNGFAQASLATRT